MNEPSSTVQASKMAKSHLSYKSSCWSQYSFVLLDRNVLYWKYLIGRWVSFWRDLLRCLRVGSWEVYNPIDKMMILNQLLLQIKLKKYIYIIIYIIILQFKKIKNTTKTKTNRKRNSNASSYVYGDGASCLVCHAKS